MMISKMTVSSGIIQSQLRLLGQTRPTLVKEKILTQEKNEQIQ